MGYELGMEIATGKGVINKMSAQGTTVAPLKNSSKSFPTLSL
jgi:hypothetical protein